MRAVVCEEYGLPDSLVVRDVAEPEVGPGQVLVDVAFASVNFPDLLIVADRYQLSVPTPFVPGSEFAGVVAAVGDGVDSLAVGDRVFGAAMTGAFAERIVVPSSALRTVPHGVALETGAGFWVAHATAYHAIRSVADVVAGDRVVVLGAAGGVGLAAVEIASLLGAEVIAAASTDAKLALCREQGASHTVNYTNQDLRSALREEFPDGIDVVLDPVGGPLAEQALRALRWRGRFVTIGFASGDIPRIPLNLVLLKGCVVMGFEIRTFSQFEPERAARDERELLEFLASGRLAPHVSSIHELDDVAAALRKLGDRRSAGKVLLRTSR